MSDTVSLAELDGQHVELLPARTVLSMFSAQGPGGLTPDEVARGFLSVLGFASSSPGADGSSDDGGSTGANNS